MIACIWACNSTEEAEVLEGDLSFKMIEFGSFYALADGLEDMVYDYMDSLNSFPSSTLSENEKEFMNVINLLKDNNLLYLPSVNLKTEKGGYRVYFDSVTYDRIKHFRRSELVAENKKVTLRLQGRTLIQPNDTMPFGVFRCHKLLSVKKAPGKTYWRK